MTAIVTCCLLLPIRSGINVISIGLVQTHSRNDSPRLHPHPRIHTHNAVLTERHSNLPYAPVPNAVASVARVFAKAQKRSVLTASATDPVTGQGTAGPTSTPAVSVVVSRIDGVQAGRVEERLHKGDGFGAGVGVALLGERDVCVEARVVGTGYVWVGLGLKVGECEGGYVDECKGGESPVLVLVRGQSVGIGY